MKKVTPKAVEKKAKTTTGAKPALNEHNSSANKLTLGLIVGIVLILLLGIFFVVKVVSSKRAGVPLQEIALPFDPDGPYALVVPRRDGNAVILKISRIASYDAISYEMAYTSATSTDKNVSDSGDGGSIDRGVTGTVNIAKGENEHFQEILFGTCSKGDTFSTLHCVFDKNVENGTLTLRIKKKDDKTHLYKMVTTWHLQKPDVALGKIVSGDAHFNYRSSADRSELSIVGFSVVNELSGMPKLPEGKQVLGKVYAFNVPIAKSFPKGEVSIELADKPSANVKIARYNEGKNQWDLLETKINGSTLSAPADSNGIFAVLDVKTSK